MYFNGFPVYHKVWKDQVVGQILPVTVSMRFTGASVVTFPGLFAGNPGMPE